MKKRVSISVTVLFILISVSSLLLTSCLKKVTAEDYKKVTAVPFTQSYKDVVSKIGTPVKKIDEYKSELSYKKESGKIIVCKWKSDQKGYCYVVTFIGTDKMKKDEYVVLFKSPLLNEKDLNEYLKENKK